MNPIRPAAAAIAAAVVVTSLAAQTPPRGQPPRAPGDSAARKDSLTRFLESFTLRNVGPAAYAGRVTALAVPGGGPYPKTIYIGSAGGGVWKTTNGGTTWQSLSEGLGAETIGDVAGAAAGTDVGLAGTRGRNSPRPQELGGRRLRAPGG